jgi:hypothetical protein
MKFSQQMVINGIIMPHDWDENGKVTEIALYTDEEEVYVVEDNRLAQELIRLLRNKVEIEGNIRKYPGGSQSISAHNYIVLEEAVNDQGKSSAEEDKHAHL